MSSSLFKSGTQANVKECRKKGEANHTETSSLPYLQESSYAKIIDFCVESDVSSIKMSKNPGFYNMQLFLGLWFYSTMKVHYLTY